jgi:protein tyrosine phosphatase (PTP) superfamily phosphohydrolase (DUF442 family)
MKINTFLLWLEIKISQTIDNLHRFFTGLPSLSRTRITDKIFLGGAYSLRALPLLRKRGVTAVVDMRESSIYQEAKYQGMRYLHLPTVDQTPPAMQDLERGVKFIDEEIAKGGKVYIHCRQGQGRGPTMAMAYLIYKGMSVGEAFYTIKKIRKFIQPTDSQLKRLQEFEKRPPAPGGGAVLQNNSLLI